MPCQGKPSSTEFFVKIKSGPNLNNAPATSFQGFTVGTDPSSSSESLTYQQEGMCLQYERDKMYQPDLKSSKGKFLPFVSVDYRHPAEPKLFYVYKRLCPNVQMSKHLDGVVIWWHQITSAFWNWISQELPLHSILTDPKECKVTKWKIKHSNKQMNPTLFHISILNSFKKSQFTHLTFHLKSTQINTEIY